MILSSIQLKNFRLHKSADINFSGKLNYITGGNGQGKTSLLDSIYYLCTTKSSDAKSDSEVVSFGEPEFEINGTFKNSSNSNVRIYYSLAENKKFYFKDEKQIYRASSVIGNFPVVLLTPSDHSITQGSPADRRKFVDAIISQASETYLKNLLDYNKTIKQRSALLSRLKEFRSASMFTELDAWSEKLVKSGVQIISARNKFITEFNGYIKDSYKTIMDDVEIPEIIYSSIDSADLTSNSDIEEKLLRQLNDRRDEELRRSTNLVGPHRDEFVFMVNDKSLRTYGSQGQHKTFQVVLRFAEFFYLKSVTNRAPIFLLDDVFGELDTRRSINISKYLSQVGQAFITLTDFTNLSYLKKEEDDLMLSINNGQVSYGR